MQSLNQEMKINLRKWLDKVSQLRTQYYALNYFTCLQLLRINREFFDLMNNSNHKIRKEVFLLLLSLSSKLTTADIKEIVYITKCNLASSQSMNMPMSLDNDDSVHIMNEEDIPGEVAKLSEEEKEVYVACTEGYEFEPQMVLEAIRKCGSNEQDVAKWCFDPENKKMLENTSKGEHSDHELNEPQIDSNNATVRELIDLEYSEDLSIEAVKNCGEDLIQCIEYCTKNLVAELDKVCISDSNSDDNSISLEPAHSDVDMSDTEDSSLSM